MGVRFNRFDWENNPEAVSLLEDLINQGKKAQQVADILNSELQIGWEFTRNMVISKVYRTSDLSFKRKSGRPRKR